MRVEVVAEIGINHEGKLEKALDMVRVAKEVGADTVKFQLVDPNFYDKNNPEQAELYKIFRRTFIKPEQHKEIKMYANRLGLNYLCTPSDIDMAEALYKIVKVNRIKIASDSAKDTKLVRYVHANKIPYLISTGHIGSANEVIQWSKNIDPKLGTILHCVSKYPTPDIEADMDSVRKLSQILPHTIGYSDHTQGIYAPIVAIGAGARVIEKHFMTEGFEIDKDVSLMPYDFEKMVMLIRKAEKYL